MLEYHRNGTLKQMLGKPMPWRTAAELVLRVASALQHAHDHHIVHRDVKPSNILLNDLGEPMLSDFGIASILEGEAEATQATATGAILGTPEYMAPEQGLGKKADNRAAHLFPWDHLLRDADWPFTVQGGYADGVGVEAHQ